MRERKYLEMGCRMPGVVVRQVLHKVGSCAYQKHWAAEVMDSGDVVIHCYRQKKNGHLEIIPNVQIKTVAPIISDSMFNRVAVELVISGFLNVLWKKIIIADFEAIAKAFKEGFNEYTQPYRVYDNQPVASSVA